jgi:hypothetical protein
MTTARQSAISFEPASLEHQPVVTHDRIIQLAMGCWASKVLLSAPNSGTSGMFKSRINGALSWLSIRIVEQDNQAPPGGGHDHNSPHCQPFIRKRGF